MVEKTNFLIINIQATQALASHCLIQTSKTLHFNMHTQNTFHAIPGSTYWWAVNLIQNSKQSLNETGGKILVLLQNFSSGVTPLHIRVWCLADFEAYTKVAINVKWEYWC